MAIKKFISLSKVQVGVGSGEPRGEGSPLHGHSGT